MPAPDCRLGVDVGGTNTDAVIMDAADRVIAKAKVPGTADITSGIVAAIDAVLGTPGVEPQRISHVMLGTTHATNAVLERRNLRRVAVLRIGGPATYSIRPMFGWPRDLVEAVSVGAEIVDGGIEFDGQDLSPLDTDAIARFLGRVGDQADGVAITSVFAPVSARHELLAAEVVKRELGEVHTSLSHEIGSIGLLERENATILNGALAGVARDVARRDAGRAHRARAAAGHVLRAERRHADEPGPGPAVSGAHHRQRAGQQRPRRRVPHRDLGFPGRRRGRDLHRPRRADQRVPARVGAGGGDRRRPDQLPDAGPGHDRARRRHGGLRRPRRRPHRAAQRRLPAPAGSAGLRRDDAHADRRRGRGRPGGHRRGAGRRGPGRPVPAAARRGAGPGRRDARRGDRPGEDLQGGPSAHRRGRRQHPGPGPDTRRQRDHPAGALRRGERGRRRHRVGQRPGGPDLPPRRRRQAGRPRRGAGRGPRAGRRGRRRPGDGADHRGGRDPARLPHLSRGPGPGQGGRHPRRRAGTPPQARRSAGG